jgi:hypothetical protein
MINLVLRSNSISNLVCDANSSTPSAKDNHANVTEFLPAGMQRSYDSCKRHTAGSLDIVIEAGDRGAVQFQQTSGCRFDKVQFPDENITG